MFLYFFILYFVLYTLHFLFDVLHYDFISVEKASYLFLGNGYKNIWVDQVHLGGGDKNGKYNDK